MGVVYIQFASEFAHSSKGGDYPACPLPPQAYRSFGDSILRCRRVIMFLCDSRLPSCALRGRPSPASTNQVTAGFIVAQNNAWAAQIKDEKWKWPFAEVSVSAWRAIFLSLVARRLSARENFGSKCLKVLKSGLKSDSMAAWRLGLKVLKAFS